MEMVQLSGLPLAEDVFSVEDLPHTLTSALQYRARIDSFNDLPEDKRPPRNLWDKPYRLKDFFDEVFNSEGSKTKAIDIDMEDVE